MNDALKNTDLPRVKTANPVIPIKLADTGGEETLEQSLYEVRKKIHPRSVHGWFAGWRVFFIIATQLAFYGTAWLEWGGRQALLFDLGARKFYMFGLVFWPQDFIYLTALLVISALSLFLFTAVAGRLWCGYACPQTVYTEMFIWIERKIEGDRGARIRLDSEPFDARKLGLKALKHGAWIALALWTGITFVGYFTPIRELLGEVGNLSLGPWETFWVLFYAFATYGNAGWMREQVCKYMCPYARFQSAMFDPDTMIITYDKSRGDPRGSRSRGADHRALSLGDCVDCGLCVQVCPTGIDIRDGLQYECIGCAACIDGCNQVMNKMGYAKGLIRYSTENALKNGWNFRQIVAHAFRPRVDLLGHPRRCHHWRKRRADAARAGEGRCHPRPHQPRPRACRRKNREYLPPAGHEHDRKGAPLCHPRRRRTRPQGHRSADRRQTAAANRRHLHHRHPGPCACNARA